MQVDNKYVDTKNIVSCEVVKNTYQGQSEWLLQFSGVNFANFLKFDKREEAVNAFSQIMIEIEANKKPMDMQK